MQIQRGTLKAFDSTNFKATVQLHGSLARRLTDVRVSRDLTATQMVVGRLVAVAFFEDRNPRDAVVFAAWTS
ncbi:MAG TPA: hypothetical protein VFO84_09290 [Dehalococcoidia bacterium]|nr:hypothetical protein [Dehalococcoidia bacterium]